MWMNMSMEHLWNDSRQGGGGRMLRKTLPVATLFITDRMLFDLGLF